jgi:transcriptional regulator with XRE-family HTH domain
VNIPTWGAEGLWLVFSDGRLCNAQSHRKANVAEQMSEQLDFLSQLTGDQQCELIRRATEAEYLAKHKIAVRPDPRFLGTFVQLQRSWLGWKKETLASLAGVSLSTVERIERGQRVSDRCLDRVAVALGYKQGDFSEPRVPIVGEEAISFLERCLEPFEGRRWVDVEPLRKQRQILEFGNCHLYLIDGEKLGVDMAEELAALREEIDFVAFVRDDTSINWSERERRRVRKRSLYKMILAHVQDIERAANAVALGGTYQAETDHPYLPKAKVALIGFFPTRTDPAAIKRRQLLAPERICLSRSSAATAQSQHKVSDCATNRPASIPICT